MVPTLDLGLRVYGLRAEGVFGIQGLGGLELEVWGGRGFRGLLREFTTHHLHGLRV